MLQVLKQAAMVSKSPNTTVLLFGESGTGKELLARAIHFNSPRGAKKFVAINCAAIPETLIESELFGHEKGAFTGADKTKQGKFEVAHEGTVFLDEIGDLSLEVQAKLLRFLQEKEFERVGGTAPIQTDVRVVGATNKDLKQLVENGQFREDLFYRINVFPLLLPPLRERRKDIIPLAEHFARIFARQMGMPETGLSDDVKKILFQYHWPGNVREVQNAVERAVIMAAGSPIGPEHFRFLLTRDSYPQGSTDEVFTLPREGINLEEVELELVNQALETTSNNQTEAAKLLGLSRGKFRILFKRLRKNNENGK
jgi:transcriptional regulator with GAF, ATPase, and Fis domain